MEKANEMSRDLLIATPDGIQVQDELNKITEAPLFPFKPSEFLHILGIILKSSIPATIALVSHFFRGLICLAFIGQNAASKELAGASLATGLANIILMTLVTAINQGFIIVGSHAHGANKVDELRVLVQRHLCVLVAISTPIILILAFSNYILVPLGIDPEIARTTVEYFRVTIPSWIGLYLCSFFGNMLMTQGEFLIQGIAQVFSLVLATMLCSLFVFAFDMPFIGPAIAKCISDLSIDLILLIYILMKPNLRQCLTLWTKRCLHGWGAHFLQMLVLGFDVFVDTVLVEFSVLIVIYINNEYAISAHSIGITIVAVLFMIPFGTSLAMQTQMGSAVGKNLRYRAQKFMAGGFFINFFSLIGLTAILITWNKEIADRMTIIPETNAILRSCLYIYSGVYFADSFKDILAGALKTLGKEDVVFKVYIFGNIFVGISAEWLFTLVGSLGYPGIWIGIGFATYLTMIILLVMLIRVDWDVQIAQVQKRLHKLEAGNQEEIV